MNSFAILADPVRRRIVEELSDGELAAGEVSNVIRAEFAISQPAVSNQLRLLRDAGVVEVRPEGARRLYRVAPGGLDEIREWVDRYSRLWLQRLDALETEIARGRPASHESHPESPAGNHMRDGKN